LHDVINEIDSESLQARLQQGDDLLLIDIRTHHIPMHLLPVRAGELPKDKDVILYCRSGARSYHACQFLTQQGWGRAINLRGGIIAWARHGFDIGPLQLD
jgi:rhodanese-related sulfurtransferase